MGLVPDIWDVCKPNTMDRKRREFTPGKMDHTREFEKDPNGHGIKLVAPCCHVVPSSDVLANQSNACEEKKC